MQGRSSQPNGGVATDRPECPHRRIGHSPPTASAPAETVRRGDEDRGEPFGVPPQLLRVPDPNTVALAPPGE